MAQVEFTLLWHETSKRWSVAWRYASPDPWRAEVTGHRYAVTTAEVGPAECELLAEALQGALEGLLA